jgi:hypothetical protein
LFICFLREPCASRPSDPTWDISQWTALIHERSFLPWLVSAPQGEEDRLCRQALGSDIMKKEEMWKEEEQKKLLFDKLRKEGKDVNDFAAGLAGDLNLSGSSILPNVRSVPLRFLSPDDYADVFEPLCEIEAEYDRQMKEGQNKTNVKVRWEMGLCEVFV